MTAILVVNYNKYEDTIDCVASILKSETTEQYKIVVIDNASSNDSLERLQILKENGKVVLLTAEENKGYCAGNNIGIKYAFENFNPDFIWILNPDTLVEKDTLQKLHDFAAKKDDLGILGNKLVYYPDTQYLQGLGGSDIRIQKGGKFAPGKHFYHMYPANTVLPEVVSVDLIIGASMYIPANVFKTIGFMDERFHLYGDETEFCCRAAKFGFRNYAISSATVYHKEGWRQAPQKQIAVYYTARNLLILTKLHFPRYIARNVFFTLFSRQLVSYIIHGKWTETRFLLKGVKDFFAGIEGRGTLNGGKRK